MALPGSEQIEPLIGGRKRVAAVEAAPERLRRLHILENLHPSDHFRAPRHCGRRLASGGSVADGDVHPDPWPRSLEVDRFDWSERGKQLSIKGWDIPRRRDGE